MSQPEFSFMYGPRCEHSHYAMVIVVMPTLDEGYAFCVRCQKILQ